MKKEKTTPGKISNSTFYRIVVLMIIICLPLLSYGQRISDEQQYLFATNETTEYQLTSINAKYVEGKVYILWSVLEPSSKCIYKLERSFNNIDFDVIYSTESYKSPSNMELSNSYIDEMRENCPVKYRVVRYSYDDVRESIAFNVKGMEKIVGEDYVIPVNSKLIANKRGQD